MPTVTLKERIAKFVSMLKEQVLSSVISISLGILGTVVFFHYTSQPTRSVEVREKLIGMARSCIEQQLVAKMNSVTFDLVSIESLDLSVSNSVVVYGSAISTSGVNNRFLMVFEPSSQGLIDKVIGRSGFYDIGYWAIIPDTADEEVIASSVNIEDLDSDGNKDILIYLKSTYADGVSKGLIVLKKDIHDEWHLMGLPSMTKIMHSYAAGESPLPKGLRPPLQPFLWFGGNEHLKVEPNIKRYLNWEITESDLTVSDSTGHHHLWMVRNGSKLKMYENRQAGYKHFGVLANIEDDEAIQGPHHLMISFFRIENNNLVPDQNWNWAYPMFSVGLEDSQKVELSEMQEVGLQAHVSGRTVFSLTDFKKVNSD